MFFKTTLLTSVIGRKYWITSYLIISSFSKKVDKKSIQGMQLPICITFFIRCYFLMFFLQWFIKSFPISFKTISISIEVITISSTLMHVLTMQFFWMFGFNLETNLHHCLCPIFFFSKKNFSKRSKYFWTHSLGSCLIVLFYLRCNMLLCMIKHNN
jgi:hypothetical protein